MKTYILLISLFFISILSISDANAQNKDSLDQKQIKFYSKLLTVGQDTAKQVVTIMDTYKEGVKKVVADATLTEEMKRVKIDGLIDEKNKKLGLLLSPSKQGKIIPSTERKNTKPGK
jgi:hypothetical protein